MFPYLLSVVTDSASTLATRPVTVRDWLDSLLSAMVCSHRPDGSSYWHLSDAAYWQSIRQDLQDVIRQAHGDELPNDWRYETVYDVAVALLDASQGDADDWDADRFADLSFEVADSLTPYGAAACAAWVAENPSRAQFDEPSVVAGSTNLAAMLRWRYCEEVQLTAAALIWAFDDLCQD